MEVPSPERRYLRMCLKLPHTASFKVSWCHRAGYKTSSLAFRFLSTQQKLGSDGFDWQAETQHPVGSQALSSVFFKTREHVRFTNAFLIKYSVL